MKSDKRTAPQIEPEADDGPLVKTFVNVTQSFLEKANEQWIRVRNSDPDAHYEKSDHFRKLLSLGAERWEELNGK